MGSIGKKRVILSQLYHPIFTILQLNCAKIPNFLKFRIIISNVLDSLQNYNFFFLLYLEELKYLINGTVFIAFWKDKYSLGMKQYLQVTFILKG